MNQHEISTFLAQVKGAPLSILVCLFGLGGTALGRDDLCMLTGYSAGSVSAGLDRLEWMGLVAHTSRYSGWILTAQARQLPLFEQAQAAEAGDLAAIEAAGTALDTVAQEPETAVSEGQKMCLGSSSICSASDSEEVFLNPESETTTDAREAQKMHLPPDPAAVDAGATDAAAEEAIAMLLDEGCPERTANRKGARDCIEAALAGGWTGGDILEAAEGWLQYARGPRGAWITHAGFLAGARVARQQWPPEETSEERRERQARETLDRIVQR